MVEQADRPYEKPDVYARTHWGTVLAVALVLLLTCCGVGTAGYVVLSSQDDGGAAILQETTGESE